MKTNNKDIAVPIPVRFKDAEMQMMQQLQELTNLSRSDLVRRACRYAFPRFLQNEVNLLTLKENE